MGKCVTGRSAVAMSPSETSSLSASSELAKPDPKNDDLAQFQKLILPYSASPEQRSWHECCHAVRALLLGGVVEIVTLECCEVSGLRRIKDLLQYRIAGLCSEFFFEGRQKLSPDPDVYEVAINEVRWGETEHAHDLHNFFSLLLNVNPHLSDDDLILRADIEIAECEQTLRHPDYLAAIQRCARALCSKGHLVGPEVCELFMRDD
jgi:hypothetical protein